MKLGDLIREYRNQHGLSQRQLANACGLSNGYVSMLEKGINPNTGKPITPAIPQLKKLSSYMGMTLTELLDKIDDMPVDISNEANTVCIAARDGSYHELQLTDSQMADLVAYLKQMPDATGDL